VVHHLVVSVLAEGVSDPVADLIKGLIPGNAFPEPITTATYPLHRMEDPFGIINLIDGGRPFGAVAAPTGRMHGVTFELGDLSCVLIDICQQATVGFTVNTGCGY
jgi:hypothetical protein